MFGDEAFGAYITIPGSILTSGGGMYLNVTYIDTEFVATNGGVDTVCLRVVKPIAVQLSPTTLTLCLDLTEYINVTEHMMTPSNHILRAFYSDW